MDSTDQAQNTYKQFNTRYDSEKGAIWCWLQPTPRPCLNLALMDELEQLHTQLTTTYKNQPSGKTWPFHYFILASKIPGIYHLGGDLELFQHYIKNGEEGKLREYAYKCIDLIHHSLNNLDLPISTITLVQGQALGGGFEIALSCDVIVAERRAKMGFPEILFNLFPGMGAYNLLTRRVGSSLAERIILSGDAYDAEELFEMGIVDVLAENGEGENTITEYLESHNQSHNTIRAIKQIRQIVHPISREKLMQIVDVWVKAAMGLSKKDLTKMERLLYLQKIQKDSQIIQNHSTDIINRKSDWRKIDTSSFPLKTHLGDTVCQDRRKRERRKPNQDQQQLSPPMP